MILTVDECNSVVSQVSNQQQQATVSSSTAPTTIMTKEILKTTTVSILQPTGATVSTSATPLAEVELINESCGCKQEIDILKKQIETLEIKIKEITKNI